MLEQAQKFVRERPIESAAAAIGVATLAWVLWPRKKPMLLPPPPPKPPPPPPEPVVTAPAPPPGPPRLPGNSPRAVEANAVLDRLDALSDGTFTQQEGPYTRTITLAGPYFVSAPTFHANKENARGRLNVQFATLNEARAYLYEAVLIGRAAFATNNTGGCWRTLGTCSSTIQCNMDGTRNWTGSGGFVARFVPATNGLDYLRLSGTHHYDDGTSGTVQLEAHTFNVPLPQAYGPDPSGDKKGICLGPPCQDPCAWLRQDWEVWDMLGVPPFFDPANAGL